MAVNNVVLMGRLTADPELKITTTNKEVCGFNLAVDKYKEGADFIPCVAWEKNAEFLCNYFKKGSMVAVVGRLQSRKYEDKDGNNRNVTEVVVDRFSFTGERKQDNQKAEEFPPVEDTLI